jgi:hypothetical protein
MFAKSQKGKKKEECFFEEIMPGNFTSLIKT